jgi:hypothetical protein
MPIKTFLLWDFLQTKLFDLGLALGAKNVSLTRTLLKDLVPGYQPVARLWTGCGWRRTHGLMWCLGNWGGT